MMNFFFMCMLVELFVGWIFFLLILDFMLLFVLVLLLFMCVIRLLLNRKIGLLLNWIDLVICMLLFKLVMMGYGIGIMFGFIGVL